MPNAFGDFHVRRQLEALRESMLIEASNQNFCRDSTLPVCNVRLYSKGNDAVPIPEGRLEQ